MREEKKQRVTASGWCDGGGGAVRWHGGEGTVRLQRRNGRLGHLGSGK